MRIDIRPASATQLSNLRAVANNVKSIDLTWDLPISDPSYRAAQIWVSTINDVNTAALVATVAGNYYSYNSPDLVSRYFWIRTVNEFSRTDGPFTGPANATAKLLMTSDIGEFDLTTAKIIGTLSTGNITGLGALATLNTVDVSKVNNLGALATADRLYANQIGAGTLAAGVVYAGEIDAAKITAGILTGRTVQTSSGSTRVEMTASNNCLTFYSGGTVKAQVGAGGGNVSCYSSGTIPGVYASGSTGVLCDGGLVVTGSSSTGSISPSGSASLGDPQRAWSSIYSATAVTVTSDVRAKADIQDSDLGLEFIMKLRPISYRLAVGYVEQFSDPEATGPFLPGQEPKIEVPYEGTRRHYGFPAQNVKEALGEIDAGIWTLADKDDPDSRQALRYEELIAPMVRAMQEMSARITELEARLAEK